MLNFLLLGLLLTARSGDWRSEDFKKAEAEVIAQIDQRPGSAVILELKRTSPTECAVLAELFGKGTSLSLVAYPMSDTSPQPKFIRVIDQEGFGMQAQSKSLKFNLTIPENETEMRFILMAVLLDRTKGMLYRNVSPLQVKQLPVAKEETKLLVFYLPRGK